MHDSSRWSRPAGYRNVLTIAIPLVISTSSMTLQQFIDRIFLIWYSPEAIAAAMPAGMLQFTLISFFLGMAGYANAFVAQYHGAGHDERIGPAIWQSIYFALLAGLLLPCFAPFSSAIFRAAGHAPAVQPLEASYFRILLLGAIFPIYNSAISCFYTGLGRNWPVLWVNTVITLVNLTLDYLLIFGNLGFPRWGIAGAAWATNIGNAAGSVAYTVLILQAAHRRHYHTLSGWRPRLGMLRRLVRFGLPAGVQFSVDMLGFTFFLILVGRIGTAELSATNLAFQINALAFMPMVGFGVATSTLVGQWLGRGKPEVAARAAWSSLHLAVTYMAAIAIAYVAVPWLFLDVFAARADPVRFAEIRPLAVVILRFVAAYCVLDTLNIIMGSALKGAGDTRFVMFTAVIFGWTVMVIPTWIFCGRPGGSVYLAWAFLTAYVNLTGIIYLLRFLRGKWRSMRVIEHAPPLTSPVKALD